MIEKRFPADTTLEDNTFLNDKKINGELYALLQKLSLPNREGDTIVGKKYMPKQSEMCNILHIKSPKTLRTHMQYLIESGYVIKLENGDFFLPNKEDMYLKIPLPTIQYLTDNCREHVVKIYIYLGQRYKYAQTLGRNYEFTLKEIAKHIGLNANHRKDVYSVVNNALDLLYNSGLIDFVSFVDVDTPKKRLTMFNLDYIKNKK